MMANLIGLMVLATAAAALLVVSPVAAGEQKVFLPPDCDVLQIVGNGFSLKLEQFEAIKNTFEEIKNETEKVETPRSISSEASEDPTNVTLFGETNAKEEEKDYGFLNEQLARWVNGRAQSLMTRVLRYGNELSDSRGPSRIVLDILLLNTLVDLENLVKEKVPALIWLERKLNKVLKEDVHKEARVSEVRQFVVSLIKENEKIERGIKGTNKPGLKWVANTQAIKRVLHEQRFSQELSEIIVKFLSDDFSMMKRSVVYDQNIVSKRLDDGLYCKSAKVRVPVDFPFSAQDAISHGAFN